MAFYTINKHIKQNNIKPETLTPKVFDYIFYGKGSPAELKKAVGIKVDLLEEMRNEFLYTPNPAPVAVRPVSVN